MNGDYGKGRKGAEVRPEAQRADEAVMSETVLAGDFNISRLLAFVFPTIFMMVFMGLYTVVDTVFVSRFVSTDALAAINVACPVINTSVGLGTMLASGGNAALSRSMGAGRLREAREGFVFLCLAGTLMGMIFLSAGLFWMDELLGLLGAEGTLTGLCRDYLSVLLLFMPAGFLQTLFASLFVTEGRPGLGSALSIGGGLMNLILDYVFIVLFDMGIRGAALGTGCGYLVPALGGLFYALGNSLNRSGHGGNYIHAGTGVLAFCRPAVRLKVLAESCLNGSSEMVGQLSAAITTLVLNRTMLRLLGEDGVAAGTILIYLQFLLHTVYIGFSMGAAPVIGFCHGSGDEKRGRRIIRSCFYCIAVFSGLVFLTAFLGSPWLTGIFVPRGSAVYEIAVPGLRIFSFGFLFCGFNLFTSAMLTAKSDGRNSAVLAFLRTFVFLLGGLLLLPIPLGHLGVWLAVPAAETAAFLFAAKYLQNSM